MAGQITEITDQMFESEVIKSSTPVLVDFWAPWCAPCRALAPLLEDIANDYGDKLRIVKVDVDKNKEFASKFGVRGIPNLILFKDGQAQEQMAGCGKKHELIEFINRVV